MDVCRGRSGPCGAPLSPHDLHSARTVDCVEATSEKMPSNPGLDKPLLGAFNAGTKSLPVATAVPTTPSTACRSTYSAVTPAMSYHPSSGVWSQSSRGNTLEGSPASSMSSTATELEEGSTQTEPIAVHQVDTSASNVEQLDNNIEEPGEAGGKIGYEAEEGSSSQSRGAKRLWEETLRSHRSQHIQHGSSPRLHSICDMTSKAAFLQAPTGDLVNHLRKGECLEMSQYLRLDGHPTPAAGPRSHRNQIGELGAEESVQSVRRKAMRDGAMESPKTCLGRRSQKNFERSQEEMAGKGSGDGTEQVLPENFRGQERMGSCETGAGADSCLDHKQEPVVDPFDPAEQSDGDGMAIDGAEHEPLLRGNDYGATFSLPEKSSSGKISGWLGDGGHSCQVRSGAPLPAATCGDHRERSGQESIDKPVLVAARTEEAAAIREAGVTGDEGFKDLMRKLVHARKWKWGPPVNKLSNDLWILKRETSLKKAKLGVEKFAGSEKFVKYVRGVLGLANIATLDGKDGNIESGNAGEERAADDRNGDRSVGSDGKEQTEEEQEYQKETKTTTEPNQSEPSVSTSKGRALQATLEALNPSNAPNVLQQRTTEFNQVLRFVTNCVQKASGGSLYLCGVPGTGKTQTMAHVQAKVHEEYSKGDIPAPVFHTFTGTEFTSPGAMHGALWLAVTGAKEVEDGMDIEKKLTNKLKYWRKTPTLKSPMLVVVLDEIDQLMTQNRQVLRKLFGWADAPKSRLVLVGLANSLDFDINFSDLKKAPQRLLFQSYTPEDLASILTERVGATVHHSAIQFCSKKAAATTGDARRAINMCREAVVLAEQELQDKLATAVSEYERDQLGQGDGNNLVTIKHMARAVAAGNAAKYAGAIAGLSFHAKVVLAVAAATVGHGSERTGGAGANAGRYARLTQGDLQEKCMGAWSRLQTGGGPSQVEFTGIIDLLAASGLLVLKSKQQTGGRARELILRIEFADLEAALGDQPFFKTVTEI